MAATKSNTSPPKSSGRAHCAAAGVEESGRGEGNRAGLAERTRAGAGLAERTQTGTGLADGARAGPGRSMGAALVAAGVEAVFRSRLITGRVACRNAFAGAGSTLSGSI